jgi:uncharacterized protein involved in exopolysaccharide biosynthesis
MITGERSMEGTAREARRPDADGRDVPDLLRMVWRGRWTVVAVALAFAAAGIAYAVLGTRWYRAEVLMVPAKDRGMDGLMSQFGGLASLAGINLGASDDAEPMAVLKSRGFVQGFIEEHKLETVLLAHKWDAARGTWKGDEEKWPDIRDAVDFFDRKVRRVVEDRKTGVITLAVEWKDPAAAAQWANALAARLNDRMRSRAIAESTENVRYLKQEIATNDLVALQQPMGKLLELELQQLMLARNNKQYSFRIVDTARVPKKPVRPQKVAVVAISLLLGALFGALALFVSGWIRAEAAPSRRA